MSRKVIHVALNGVTGRMGYRQHPVRVFELAAAAGAFRDPILTADRCVITRLGEALDLALPADVLLGRGHVGDGVIDFPPVSAAVPTAGYPRPDTLARIPSPGYPRPAICP